MDAVVTHETLLADAPFRVVTATGAPACWACGEPLNHNGRWCCKRCANVGRKMIAECPAPEEIQRLAIKSGHKLRGETADANRGDLGRARREPSLSGANTSVVKGAFWGSMRHSVFHLFRAFLSDFSQYIAQLSYWTRPRRLKRTWQHRD